MSSKQYLDPSIPVQADRQSSNLPPDSDRTTSRMCQINPATFHAACGRPRTSALINECAESSQSGLICSTIPTPQAVEGTACWRCLHAQVSAQEFKKRVLDQLVLPETSETSAPKVEESWLDAHRRMREEKLVAAGTADST